MNELQFVVFREAVLYDYIDIILPHVWDELATVDSFEEAGIITLAAELEGETVGAAIARITSGDEVQIYSLYVDPDHRRRKIGTALLDMILELAGRRMEEDDTWNTRVVETIDYTLEDEEYEGFRAFLESVGFVRFDELHPLFMLSGSEAKKLAAEAAAKDTAPHPLDDQAGEAERPEAEAAAAPHPLDDQAGEAERPEAETAAAPHPLDDRAGEAEKPEAETAAAPHLFDDQAGEAERPEAEAAAAPHLFDELTGEARAAAEEFLGNLGIPVDLTLTGFVGTLEHPLGAACAIPGDDGDYAITSYGEDLEEDSYRRLLCRMFAAVAAKTDDFTILADGTRNPYPKVWAGLSEHVRTYRRCMAHRIVIFEGE